MYTPIQLDKVRNFKYGMRAVKLIEDLTGQPISKIDFENMTMTTLAIVVYAGLVHEDLTLTTDSVIDLIDDYSDIQTVAEAMGKAMTEAFGKGKKQLKAPKK